VEQNRTPATNANNSKNLTTLVTGGTDGLGRAASILLAQRGYHVFAGSRNAERRAALEKTARERKLPLEAIDLDVTDDDSVSRAVAEVERRAGPVEVLVNNAGVVFAAAIEEIRIADMRRQFETNFLGVIRVTQRVLPEMRRRRRGRIVNMSSIAGKTSMPIMGPYSASKFALEAISDSLRLEVLPFGIHVALIEPGIIPTSIGANARELSASYAESAPSSPYGPIYQGVMNYFESGAKAARTTPEDCARVILRAIEDDPPRERYLVTPDAKVASLMKWLLSDRAFDRGIAKRLRIGKPRDAAQTGTGE
jgi:NAD(P)-dependent dehydrogenase (short-subunit alcohol dehydrogenase family)